MTIASALARTKKRNARWAEQVSANDAMRRMIRHGATIEQVRARFACSASAYERMRGNIQ